MVNCVILSDNFGKQIYQVKLNHLGGSLGPIENSSSFDEDAGCRSLLNESTPCSQDTDDWASDEVPAALTVRFGPVDLRSLSDFEA